MSGYSKIPRKGPISTVLSCCGAEHDSALIRQGLSATDPDFDNRLEANAMRVCAAIGLSDQDYHNLSIESSKYFTPAGQRFIGRRFCVTRNGYMGRVPPGTRSAILSAPLRAEGHHIFFVKLPRADSHSRLERTLELRSLAPLATSLWASAACTA